MIIYEKTLNQLAKTRKRKRFLLHYQGGHVAYSGMESHEWNDKTEDGKRYFRATIHAGSWRFQKTLKTDPDWESIPNPDAELWLKLREILWKKYQRKRGSWTIIERIDKMLEKNFGIHIKSENE
jgi:hypothetical protein